MKAIHKIHFFIFHFFFGFSALWLSYYYVQITLQHAISEYLWVMTLLETSFLIMGVVWGNLGWDSYKKLDQKPLFSACVYELSKSTGPLTIVLPIFLAAFGFALNFRLGGFVFAFYNLPFYLLALSSLMVVLLWAYKSRRSGQISSIG